MGRGGVVYLSYTATVLLATASNAAAGLWDVSIDLAPAPSPQDGPPFSAHATRDRALLPYQIIGIVGAYVGTTLIVGTLLFTVGRKLRKHARAMSERPTEMVKPMNRTFETSPMNSYPKGGWRERLRSKSSALSIRSGKSGSSNVGSPGVESVVSFDQQIVDGDRRKQEADLARIYKSVFEFENHKSQQDVTSTEIQQAYPALPIVNGGDKTHIQTSGVYHQAPQSPVTPGSRWVHAIYPQNEVGITDASHPKMHLHQTQASPGDARADRMSLFGNKKTAETAFSPGPGKSRKDTHKSIRGLKISAPIQRRPDDDNSDGARTPLRPQRPLTPPTARTTNSQFTAYAPETATSANFSGMQDDDDERMDEIRALPRTSPQRGGGVAYGQQEAAMTASTNKRSAANVNNTLPFRENKYNPQQNAPSPAGGWNFSTPRSPGLLSQSMKSPSIREHIVDIGARGLDPPPTGCATPYNWYMPMTPVTPITPHLETRAERKQRQRDERAIRGAITEEDQVADDDDMWGGY